MAKKLAFVFFFFVFPAFTLLFSPGLAFASVTITPATYPDGNAGDQTWTKAESPYIIDGAVSVRFGSFTLEPGTVVKFTAGSNLTFHADVHTNIVGTASEPIYFTSIKDDSVGGDTNGDGAASTSAAGDWGFVSFGGGSWNGNMQLSYAKFRYGGSIGSGVGRGVIVYPTLVISYWWYNGSPGFAYDLSHVEASHGRTGALFLIGENNTLNLSDSSFYDNADYGLYKYVDPFLTNPDRTGPIDASNNWWGSDTGPQNSTLNSAGTGNAVFGNHLTIFPWLSADPMPDPAPAQTEPNPVIIIPGILGSAQKDGVWTLDPVEHTYDNLVDTLVANGYVYDQTLFTFPYDWTQSNRITAEALKTKIDAVKTKTGSSKVDLVAHSMGGLVAREYLQSTSFADDVGHVIFLGTPHLGAPLSYFMYEGGETDNTTDGFFLGLYLSHLAHEAGFTNLFDYLHLGHVASVRELLPVYGYIFDQSNSLRPYPDDYPTNPFLEELNSSAGTLSTDNIEITNFIGNDQDNDTINSFDITGSTTLPKWSDGQPISINRSEGDGTVPIISAAPVFLPDSQTIQSSHSELPTAAEGEVYSVLTGKVASELINQPSYSRYFVVRAFSPIDFQITAPDGKKVGKDFDTGEEFDEIPGAFYSGYDTDTEYIVIPDPEDGQYTIGVQGTGSGGAYTISTDYFANSTSTEVNANGSIAGGAITQAIAIFNSSSPDPVVVQQSLSDLIANLISAVNALQVAEKQKSQLLNKIQNINHKIAKQTQKQSKLLAQLQTQVQKQAGRGKIDTATASSLSNSLDSLIDVDATVPIDPSLIQQFLDEVNALPSSSLKNSLLNKIARLSSLIGLNRSLVNMTNTVTRQQTHGKLSSNDAQKLIDILEQIQNAL